MPTAAREVAHPWYPFVLDVNGDGQFTISDLGMWLQHAYFLPGDWIIWCTLTYSPTISRFFEIGVSDYRSTLSALLSVFVWLAVMLLIMLTSHFLMRVDRAITGAMVRLREACLLRFRITRRLISSKLRQAMNDRKADARADASEEAQLTAEEFEVLKAHADAEPPAALPVSAVVRATALSGDKVNRILVRLKDLELLRPQALEGGKEPAYALTKPGRAFVVFRKLSAS
jgi:hypothetical protein